MSDILQTEVDWDKYGAKKELLERAAAKDKSMEAPPKAAELNNWMPELDSVETGIAPEVQGDDEGCVFSVDYGLQKTKGSTFCLTTSCGRQMVVQGGKLRRLTPVETERLQAFPEDWTRLGVNEKGKSFYISDRQRYRQCGNSVTVNVIKAIADRILPMFAGGEPAKREVWELENVGYGLCGDCNVVWAMPRDLMILVNGKCPGCGAEMKPIDDVKATGFE